MRKYVLSAIVGGVALSFAALFSMTSSKDCAWASVDTLSAGNQVEISQQPLRCDSQLIEVSWFSWLAGKSSSYQFHFLDLLELLHSNKRPNRAPVSPVN